MNWDFAEANPLSDSTGNFSGAIDWVAEVIESSACGIPGIAKQLDATVTDNSPNRIVISTDPPYYDNIGYATYPTSSMFGYVVLLVLFIPIFSIPSLLLKPKNYVLHPIVLAEINMRRRSFLRKI